MANVLPVEKQLRVLAALVEGNSERAIERMTDVSRPTINRFARLCGLGAARLHDKLVRDLTCNHIQVDEIWGYVGKKQARLTERDPADYGDAYTFVAMDTNSRMVISYLVGKRDEDSAREFIADVRARLLVMPAMTSDGFAPYIAAIGASFGPSIDYGQMVKNYRTGARRGPDHRYEPARDPFITKKVIYGAPDMRQCSTAYVERNNGTMRHHIGRQRRLTYAFSKKLDNHGAAIALNYAWYNLGTIVKTLRMTPAMAAHVTDHVWTLQEFLDAIMAAAAEPEEKPTTKPLAPRVPEGVPARALPSGRGFLRLVKGEGGAAPSSSTTPPPTPASTAAGLAETVPGHGAPASPEPAEPAVPTVAPVNERQLDLFAWRPKPSEQKQLGLFGDD